MTTRTKRRTRRILQNAVAAGLGLALPWPELAHITVRRHKKRR